jgi:hypothetical protein
MAIIIPALPYTLTNGTTADANQVMADLNDIVNGTNNNAAHNGPNSDITSLTGLTTPLSIAQGGTGVGLVGAAGTIPVSDGAAFAWSSTVNGPLTVTGAANLNGVLTVTGAANLNGMPNNIKGVTDGSNAGAGQVGEFVSASGGPFSVANGVIANIAATTLSAGDWDVWGTAYLATASAGASAFICAVSPVTNTIPSPYCQLAFTSAVISAGTVSVAPIARINFSGSGGINLNAQVYFASGTASVSAALYARRRR